MNRLMGLLVLIASTALMPRPVHACGGLLCNAAQPVNQAAERILFAEQPDGSITAIIQIQYTGPAEQFAWLLPVGGTPRVEVSSNTMFDRLQTVTNPFYQSRLTTGCSDASVVISLPESPPSGSVSVLTEASIGPYDFVIIGVDSSAPDPAADALSWLADNEYDVDAFGADRLRPYLQAGMNLLAFRLTKGNDVGAIRPVEIGFGPGAPMIPIRPTAIAAVEDMGIMVWIVGQHRAVSTNYAHVELNDALINWNQPGTNYDRLVSRAVDEAGSHAFVTEVAARMGPLPGAIWTDADQRAWQDVRSGSWSGREGDLLARLPYFSRLDGMSEVYRRFLPLPDGVGADAFLACVSCYLEDETDLVGFEPELLIAAMATEVTGPMVRARALFERAPYITRLYTTLSPSEMTVDPVFGFNADLDDVSNYHFADRSCGDVVLPHGERVRSRGAAWPFRIDDDSMPASRRILRFGTEGYGAVVEDNRIAIRERIKAYNQLGTDDGCSAGGRGAGGTLAFAFVLLCWRRFR